MKISNRITAASVVALMAGLGVTSAAHAGQDVFKPIVESSLRVEQVDQQGLGNNATALTWRNRLGVQTAEFHHLSALVELENTTVLAGDYNSTLNGKTAWPTVLDPEVTELNRAQITWAPSNTSSVTVGRQRIILDDARFVGNAGWRQDEQTFDAIRFDTAVGKLKVTGAYLARINRVVGDEKDWNSNSYLLNASYDFGPGLKLTAFTYALKFSSDAQAPTPVDIANAKASSVTISGLRASGSRKLADLSLGYVLQYAGEEDAGHNPQTFKLKETMFEVNGSYKMLSGRINYESLGGNGVVGFVAPLASPHPFQGFADAFSATGGNKTFVNGIDDLSYTLSLTLPYKHKSVVSLTYHDFTTVRLDQDIGEEWDAVATVALTPKFSLMLKYADFARASLAAPASRTKTWVMVQYKL